MKQLLASICFLLLNLCLNSSKAAATSSLLLRQQTRRARASSLLRGSTLVPEDVTTNANNKKQPAVETKVRSMLHEQAGSLHTVLLARGPGRPVPLGMKIRHGQSDKTGMEVEMVESGSGADLAGIKIGDVIKVPKSALDLEKIIYAAAVGVEKDASVIFQVEREDLNSTDKQLLNLRVPVTLDIVSFGLALSTTTRSDGERECPVFEIASITPASLAAHSKPPLVVGDVVLAVNGIPAPSEHLVVERLLSVSSRVVFTIFDGDDFQCPPTTEGDDSTTVKSASLNDAQLRNILHTLTPTDIAERLDIVDKELKKLQNASQACIGSDSCTTGHIERIQQALREETQGCVRAQSMFSLHYKGACSRAVATAEKKKCAAAKTRTDKAISEQCDPTQRDATCTNIRSAWSEYYKRRCALLTNAKQCQLEQQEHEHKLEGLCKKQEESQKDLDGPKDATGAQGDATGNAATGNVATGSAAAATGSAAAATGAAAPKIAEVVKKNITLPASGVELHCDSLQKQCNEIKDANSGDVVCGTNGKEYNTMCSLKLASCLNMQKAAKENKEPFSVAIDVMRTGPCEPCRQVSLSKNTAAFGNGFGMVIDEWTTASGQSFPEIKTIVPDTVAANSGLVLEGDIVVTMGTASTCNKWSEKRIISALQASDNIEFTVCTKTSMSSLVSDKICPKATLKDCTRLQLHDNVLGNDNITLSVRKGKCGSFPIIETNSMPAGAVGALLAPNTVLFSVGGTIQCNHGVVEVEEIISSSTEPLTVDACTPKAVDTDFVCDYICKTPVVVEPPPLIAAPKPVEKQINDDALLWPQVVFEHVDQENLTSKECRRVKLIKAKSKYGIDIEEVHDGASRAFTITHVHEGRGLDQVDLLVNDTLSIVDGISVDDMKNVTDLERLLAKGNTTELWISRGHFADHDIQRTLVRDPHGFGVEFGQLSTTVLTCASQLPSIIAIDHLMPGLIDPTTNQPLFNVGDIVVSIEYGQTLCEKDVEDVDATLDELQTVVLEICPSDAASVKNYDNILCQQCQPPPVPTKVEIITEEKKEEKKEEKEEEKEEEEETLLAPATEIINKTIGQSKNVPERQPPLTEIELCEVDGNKQWCPSNFPTLTHKGLCVSATLLSCPVQPPQLNPNELLAYCREHGEDPLHCSRAKAVNVPIIPALSPTQIEPPKAPEPPKDFHPILEKLNEECRPGSFCPLGTCPDLYIKTNDGYCAPGKDAPRVLPHDRNHICLPGQWCPPGYDCPTGFELSKAGGDGFCFQTKRQGPTIAPEFKGADFDPYSVDATTNTATGTSEQ